MPCRFSKFSPQGFVLLALGLLLILLTSLAAGDFSRYLVKVEPAAESVWPSNCS